MTRTQANQAPRARALRSLRGWIADGTLADGEPLPPERELAKRLGVDRTAVRWALETLDEEGHLRRRGARTRLVVATPRQADPSPGPGILGDTLVVLSTKRTARRSADPSLGMTERLHAGIIAAAEAEDSHLLHLNPKRLDPETIDVLVAGRPLGVAVPDAHTSLPDPELLERLRAADVPVVLYGAHPEYEAFDRVVSDQAAGCERLVRWLVEERGRRRILPFWRRVEQRWFEQRCAGYERGMRAAGLEPLPIADHAPVPKETPPEKAARALVGFLIDHLRADPPVDAILALSDGQCPWIAGAVELCGRDPVRDLDIAGFDHYTPEGSFRPVATVDKRERTIGHQMVLLLAERAEGSLPDEPQERVVTPDLVVGELYAG